MADQTNDFSQQPTPQAPPPRQKRKHRGRTLLIAAGIVLLLILLLVIFLPTLAGTAPVRSFVVGKINDNLNGTVAIDDWDLGWFSGIQARGVLVRDAAGNEIARLDSLQTGLTAWEAARGVFDLDDVTIDGLHLNVVRDADGNLNLAQLVKEDPDAPTDDEPATLPDLRGRIVINNAGGTFTSPDMPTTRFTLDGRIVIPDIHSPIEHDLEITTQLGESAKPGRITLAGSLPIARNNQIDIDFARLRQRLAVAGIDLASLAVLLPPDSGITALGGVSYGELTISGGEQSLDVSGNLQATGLVVGGPALEGDTYRSETATITIPQTIVRLPADGESFNQARFAIGSGDPGAALEIAIDQGRITARGDLSGESLVRLANNLTPGADGTAAVTVELDLGALARQLPNAMQVNADLQALQGRLAIDAQLTMTPQRATPSIAARLTEVSAVNARTNQPVRLAPITLAASATSLGGGGDIPDIRNIQLSLDSGTDGFARADIRGDNLGSIQGEVRASLARMQQELSQFIDFGAMQLAGELTTRITTEGDLSKAGATSVLNVVSTLTALRIEGIDDTPPIDQSRLQFAIGGTLHRGAEGQPFLRRIRGMTAILQAGAPQNPAIDAELAADIELTPTGNGDSATVAVELPRWEVRRFLVDMPVVQQDTQAVRAALVEREVAIPTGRITLAARGSYADDTVTLADLSLVMNEFTLQANGGKTIVDRLTTTLAAVGRVALGDDATHIAISRLDLSEPRNLVSLKKTSGGDLRITLPAGGGFAAAGQIQAGVSLGLIADILQALEVEPDPTNPALPVRRGFATTTLDFNADEGQTRFDANVVVRNLVLLARGEPLAEQELQIAANGRMTMDLSDVRIASATINSQPAKITINDLRLALAGQADDVPAWAALQGGTMTVDIPDAGAAWAMMEAFSPPSPPADGEAPPMRVTGGTLAAQVELSQADGRLRAAVRQLKGENIAMARGEAAHTLQPFTVAADAQIGAGADGAITSILIDELNAQLGFAEITAADTVRISGLGEGQTPQLTGTIRASGEMEPTLALINALGGSVEPPAYAGRYQITHRLNTQEQTVSATLDATIIGLRSLAEDGVAIEDELRLVGDVRADFGTALLTLDKLALSMPRSNAISLVASGTVQQFTTQRQLDLKADLNYDAERLWQVIYPLLSTEAKAEMADAKILGVEQRTFVIGGSFPADQPFNEAIRSVTATGGIGLRTLQAVGWDIRELDVPFKLENGRLQIQHAAQTPGQPYRWTAQINGGNFNLALIEVDLTGESIRISTPENYKLIVRASMNPVLADKWFGRFINPMLNGADQARGRVDVTILYCNDLAIDQFAALSQTADAQLDQARSERTADAFEQWRRGGQAISQPAQPAAAGDPGKAELAINITEVQLGSPLTQNLLRMNLINADIKDARVIVEGGTTKSIVPIEVNKQATMTFHGSVRMDDAQILNMVLDFPPELLPREIKEMIGDSGLRRMPKVLKVPFTGSLHSPQFDLMGAVTQSMLGGDRGLEGLIDLFREPEKDKKQQPPPQQPSQPQPQGDQPISQPRR